MRAGLSTHRGELTTHNHLAVCLHRQSPDVCIRAESCGEGRVKSSVSVDSRQPRPLRAVVGSETAANDKLPGRRLRQRTDKIIRAAAGVEGRVERAVGIHSRDAATRRGVEVDEIPRDHCLAVRLNSQRIDNTVRAGMRHIRRCRGDRRRHAGAEINIMKLIHRACRGVIVIKQNCDSRFANVSNEIAIDVIPHGIEVDMEILIELREVVVNNSERQTS